jgi:hypothetical protein
MGQFSHHDFPPSISREVGRFYVWWLNQGVTTAHAADVQALSADIQKA